MNLFIKVSFISLFFFAFACSHQAPEEKTAKQRSLLIKDEDRIAAATDTSTNQSLSDKEKTIHTNDTLQEKNVTVSIFSNDTTADAALHGYGYNILMNGKLYVHQPHIPAVPGNKGFASAGDAKKTGALIRYKVEHNIMPPSVTVEELDSLQIVY